MKPKDIVGLLQKSFKEWGEDKVSRLGAALAYYTVFSIGPLLVLIIAVAGLVFGQEAASGQIVGTISGVLGPDGAKMVEQLIKSASAPGAGVIATAVGAITLLLGAAGIFSQLKDALNTIWDVKPEKAKGLAGVLDTLKRNVLTFGMVGATAFLLLVSLVINAALAAVGDLLRSNLPGGALLWQVLNYAAMLAIITLVFALVFKVLPDARIAWRNVWIGAFLTALLFVLGQIGLGFYFGISDPGSAFGAAGALVLILVWIYYSAQIFLFGAEVTQVYAANYGTPVSPAPHANWASEEARLKWEEAGQRDTPTGAGKQTARALRASPWFR
jgi:membrane protein